VFFRLRICVFFLKNFFYLYFVYSDNMFEVMVKLVTQKVHRIWVVDAKNVVIGVVSFSDIFSQLEKK
jgi:signal-transduction protein with cAMP-binding, CBS, and nucleotidyltransferase domain